MVFREREDGYAVLPDRKSGSAGMPRPRSTLFPYTTLFRSDNGDMYVDGHKAASDVRDEFVSVTEKLMDELAQCYNVLPQLDINNTIDHRPEGDEKWFLENEKTVTQFC